MIRLLNRRFVPFFFNTSGMGEGDDEAAKAFVEGKLENPYAYLSVFAPADDGPHLATSEIYADKDDVFALLLGLLREHPEYDRFTAEEQQILEQSRQRPEDPEAALAAAELLDELGRYDEARPLCDVALAAAVTDQVRARAWRLALRMARYEKDWGRLDKKLSELKSSGIADKLGLGPTVAVERGYWLQAHERYAEMRGWLESAIERHPNAKRSGELRFYAGVACYFLGDHEAADFHWCWVQENIPDDHLARRCYIAAAREAMPYPNPELGGYAKEGLPGGSVRLIREAYAEAKRRYLAVQNTR